MSVAIVGVGVSGLACARRLVEGVRDVRLSPLFLTLSLRALLLNRISHLAIR